MDGGNSKPRKLLPNPKCKKVGEKPQLANKEKNDELFVFTGRELLMAQAQSANKLGSKPAADVEPGPGPGPRKNLLANQPSATSLWMNSASSPKGKTKKQCANSNGQQQQTREQGPGHSHGLGQGPHHVQSHGQGHGSHQLQSHGPGQGPHQVQSHGPGQGPHQVQSHGQGHGSHQLQSHGQGHGPHQVQSHGQGHGSHQLQSHGPGHVPSQGLSHGPVHGQCPAPSYRPQFEEMTPIPLPHRQTQSESSWFSRYQEEEQREKKRVEFFRNELESKHMAEKNRARPPGRVCLPPKPMDYGPEDDFYGRNNYNCGDGIIQPNIATFPSQEKMQFGDNYNHLYNSAGLNRQIQYHQHQHQQHNMNNTLTNSKSTARMPSEFYANVATISLDSNSNPSIRAPRIGIPVPVVERRPKMIVGAYDDQNFSTGILTDSASIKNARNNLSRSEDLIESKGLVQSLYLKELQEQILMKRKETEERKQREKEEEERIERKIKQDLEKMQNEYLQELQMKKERPLKHHSLNIEKRLYEYETKAPPAPVKIQENKVYSKASGYIAKKADAKPPVPPYSFSSRFLPPPVSKNISALNPENSGPKIDLLKSLTSSITDNNNNNSPSPTKNSEESTVKKKSLTKSKNNSPRSEKIQLVPTTSSTSSNNAAKDEQCMKEEFISGFKLALEKEIRRVEQMLNLESSSKN